jgi:hypothetical protein
MENEMDIAFVQILIQMIDPICVEQGRSPFDAVNGIGLAQEELGQIGAILPGGLGN